MAARQVEAVLAVFYNSEAHRATYGRKVQSNKYTKDYIQLSRRPDFLEFASNLFHTGGLPHEVPLTYKWPGGAATGDYVPLSADRPHLKWETSAGAPAPWRMSPTPTAAGPETIPGDPSQVEFAEAEAQRLGLESSGAGQPYLVAVKLRGERNVLHLRAYLAGASATYDWASVELLPEAVRAVVLSTSKRRALGWANIESTGVLATAEVEEAVSRLVNSNDLTRVASELSPGLRDQTLAYLRDPGEGLFFDPTRNHDAWFEAAPMSAAFVGAAVDLADVLAITSIPEVGDDALAEHAAVDEAEADDYSAQIAAADYSVPDAVATIKTRGSAQRAFAQAVKTNYGFRCAVTGIATRQFLVASHIVPWSEDPSIRLDPANGICLSLMIDRAFELGYLVIRDDMTVALVRSKVDDDPSLREQLEPYDGTTLRLPSAHQPAPEYLQRRRTLVGAVDFPL